MKFSKFLPLFALASATFFVGCTSLHRQPIPINPFSQSKVYPSSESNTGTNSATDAGVNKKVSHEYVKRFTGGADEDTQKLSETIFRQTKYETEQYLKQRGCSIYNPIPNSKVASKQEYLPSASIFLNIRPEIFDISGSYGIIKTWMDVNVRTNNELSPLIGSTTITYQSERHLLTNDLSLDVARNLTKQLKDYLNTIPLPQDVVAVLSGNK